MQVCMCKSKIHRATVTDANLKYNGSITIDKELIEAANILPFEKVQVVNVNNGYRAETYVIEGKAGSKEICLNGAMARHGEVGDKLIIIAYAFMEEKEAREHRPSIVYMD